MMRKHGDLLATVGHYTDDEGVRRKRRVRVGLLFRDDKSGAMSIKLDAAPISPMWGGWLAVRTGNDDDGEIPENDLPNI